MLPYEIRSAPIDDLSDWTSKGINHRAEQDSLASKENAYMYAPDCVKGNDGRYYLYYCLSGYKGNGGYNGPIGVAVCDTPDGKYEFYGHVKNADRTPLKLDFLSMSIRNLCDCYQKTFIRKRISLARYFITFFNNPPVNGSGFGFVIGRKIKKVKEIVNGNIRMLSRRLKFNV